MKSVVYGKGISGRGAYDLLLREGLYPVMIDDADEKPVLGERDLLVLSPSVPVDCAYAVECRTNGANVIGEMELGYSRCRDNDIIAVTGTNGKTTVCSMIKKVFDRCGITAHLLGNIGVSFCGAVESIKEGDIIVLETSSFQLESVCDFRPKVGMILNITPDHLERHKTFDSYVKTKESIFENQTKLDYAVLNYDDSRLRELSCRIMSNTYFFSLKEKVRGAYLEDGKMFFCGDEICSLSDFGVGEDHNAANILAVICAAKLFNIPDRLTIAALEEFKKPPHRIQRFAERDGKKYYNDSKATNIDATLKACMSMTGDTCLILGGYDKGISYYRLFAEMPSNIVKVILFGANRHSVEKTIRDSGIDYVVCDSFGSMIAEALSAPVENVLFSPATSSYDMFRDYEERGESFMKAISDEYEK